MAGSNYTVIVNAVVNQPQIQNQLNKMNLTIKAPKMSGADKIENQITRWNNQFSLMQTKSQKAFAMPSVQKEYTEYQKMVNLYRQGLVTRDDMITQINNTTTAYGKEAYAINTVNKAGMNYTEMLALAIKKIAIWMIGTQAIYGSLQQIREGVQYIKDLNKEMTNIQIVSGMSSKSIQQLAIDYNKLAKELSVTTLDVAKGSLEWIRQGKSAKETSQLLRASVMMGTLANIDQAKSTEYLTSIINGYKLSMNEVMGTIDKLVVLDNNFATSVAEIAEAMQRSANVARLSGVSLEQLASMITVVSSVTRKSADSIGESFKTILTRMENVKLGKAIDEEGEAISDVDKVLKSLGIRLRDETTLQFRNMGTVLEETAVKWKELAAAGKTVEQAQIAVAFAGTRQRENFVTLLDNWDKYNEALKLTGQALGTTEERYKIFSESVEAHSNRFKIAIESMWQKTLSPETISGIYELGEWFVTLIEKAGGLIPVLEAIISAIMIIGSAKVGKALDIFLGGIINVKKSLIGVKYAAMEAGQAASIAFGAIGLILFTTYELIQNIKGGIVDTAESFRKLKDETDSNVDNLNSLASEYESLANKQNKTADDLTRLKDIQSILNTKYNDGKTAIDFVTAAYNNESIAIQEKIKWMKEVSRLEAEKFIRDNKEVYEKAKKVKETAASGGQTYGEYSRGINNDILRSAFDWQAGYGKPAGTIPVSQAEIDAANEIIIDMEHYMNVLSGVEDAKSEVASTPAVTEQELKTWDNLSKKLSTLGDQIKSIISDFEKSGELSLSQVEQLKGMFPEEYTTALTIENGQIKLNIEQLRVLLILKARDALASAQQAYETGVHTEALRKEMEVAQAYYNSVVDGSFFAEDATKQLEEAQRQQQENQKTLLQATINMIRQETQSEIDGLKDKLDHYKAIIDARKKLLDQQKSEKDYQDTIKDKNKEIADIDNQLLALQFDNSEAAKAKRLQLEAEKAKKIEELNKTQYDHSIETQKDALDKDYDKYSENINKKIRKLEDYLKQSGTITQDALDLIAGKTDVFYQRLLNWNRIYGDGIDATIVNAWNNVITRTENATRAVYDYSQAVQQAMQFASQLGGMIAGMGDWLGGIYGSITDSYIDQSNSSLPADWQFDPWNFDLSPIDTGTIPGRPGGTYHSGGFVGGLPQLQASEEYGKLLKGEFVSTPNMMQNFINNTLPNLVASVSGNGDTIIELAVNVQGNMDKTILPQLKEAVLASITTAMQQRGKLRNVNSYSV